MQPTEKSPAMEQFLTGATGNDRRESIKANQCIPAPMGCGRVIPEGEIAQWDALTVKEFTISGWCKECQDKIFYPDDEPAEDPDLTDAYGEAFRQASDEFEMGYIPFPYVDEDGEIY